MNRLRKEMCYYVKEYQITIEKNWLSQNFDFLCLKKLSPDQFLGNFNSDRYLWILKLLVAT